MTKSAIGPIIIAGVLWGLIYFFGSDKIGQNNAAGGVDRTSTSTVESELSLATSRPTDFFAVGTVTFNSPGLKSDRSYLLYEEPGAPALYRELMFDSLSWCGTPSGGTVCLTLSTNRPFQGERVTVEGVLEGEVIVVRKLQSRPAGDEGLPILPVHNRVFIGWPEAMAHIRNCEVAMVVQTHSLDVIIDLKQDGRQVVAVQPSIDEVFRVLDEVKDRCEPIPMATE